MLNNAFRDQLLKAGVVTEDQVQKVADDEAKRKEKARQKNKQRRASTAKKKDGRSQSAKTQRSKPAAKKGASPQAKQATPATVESKAVTRDVSKHEQVDRLLKEHGINCGSGKQYSYPSNGGKLKTIEVSDAQAEQLAAGKLAIASTRQQMSPYVLLPAAQVAAVKALRAERIALFYED